MGGNQECIGKAAVGGDFLFYSRKRAKEITSDVASLFSHSGKEKKLANVSLNYVRTFCPILITQRCAPFDSTSVLGAAVVSMFFFRVPTHTG